MLYKLKPKAECADDVTELGKLPYKTPVLTVHGMVKELTAAGSGARAERKRGRGSRRKRS